jgi:undecaprenyl-diphosphatase
MITVIEAVILGVIQGITEWLPVSSSGHLAVMKGFLGDPPVIFFVLLHVGTLLVIGLYFRRDIVEVLKALARRDFTSENGKLGVLIAVGSLPTAFIGLVFQDYLRSLFDNLLAVGGAFVATGLLLLVSERRIGRRAVGYVDSLLVGIAQGLAIIPGISRSGATISAGLLRQVDRQKAFRFSFLLSIPAVIGAAVGESRNLNLLIGQEEVFAVFTGIVSSVVVGYISLLALSKILTAKRFSAFGVYCIAVGASVIALNVP